MLHYMPPEWHRHEATLLTWPHDIAMWRGLHTEVERTFAEFAARLSHVETVYINVPDTTWEQRVLKALRHEDADLSAVRTLHIPSNDVWARDHGPTVVFRREDDGASRRVMLDWVFNAWGSKYAAELDDAVPSHLEGIWQMPRVRPGLVMEGGALEVNGEGDLLTTESVLLNPNRNPELSREEIEERLRGWLGVRQILWLGDGLEGDDTDGHIDDIARFTDERTVVVVCPQDTAHPDHAVMAANMERLRTYRTSRGNALRVVPLPAPEPVRWQDEHLPASYANFYIANGCVFVPVFHQPTDSEALSILSDLMPDRDVIGIDCRALVSQYGALHCISQQLPVAPRS
jgi:agmatine deiminase